MCDDMTWKILMYSQMNDVCRKVGRPLLCHNDKLKKNNMLPFERVTPDRSTWRNLCIKGITSFEKWRIEHPVYILQNTELRSYITETFTKNAVSRSVSQTLRGLQVCLKVFKVTNANMASSANNIDENSWVKNVGRDHSYY